MTDYQDHYSPEQLAPVPRAAARDAFSNEALSLMHGEDTWHCYELSWLAETGVPRVALLWFSYPSTSSHLIESKSLKLYLMSFNQTTFSDHEAVRTCIHKDLSAILGTEQLEVRVEHPDTYQTTTLEIPAGRCLDDEVPEDITYEYQHDLLQRGPNQVEERLYSHLLRSVCPLTGQPDYGTVELCYRGPQLHHASLLAYIISFRNHGDYHEHCAERMFADLMTHGACQELSIRCSYTRRGGIDISPCRYTETWHDKTPYRRFARH